MKNIPLTQLFLLLITNSHADDSLSKENEKNIEYVVSHGVTIYGDTDINLDHEDVVLRHGKNIVHYPPSQIEKIAVEEGTDEVVFYFSGAFGLNQQQHLFKILSEGHRTLLYREGLKFSAYEETIYSPYFILVDGQVYALSTNKKELLCQIDKNLLKELLSCIKDHKINLSDKVGLTKLFDYYNSVMATN